jgi:hypothetical protein
MISLEQTFNPSSTTRLIAGVVVPDTPIVSRAIEFARGNCEPYLFNHVMRSWLFSEAIAQLKGSGTIRRFWRLPRCCTILD